MSSSQPTSSTQPAASAVNSVVCVRALRPTPLLDERPGGPEGFALPPLGRAAKRRAWRTLSIVAATLVSIGLLGAVGFDRWDRTAVHRGGPVSGGAGINGARLAVGETVVFRGFLLRNASKTPAVLEDVRILGLSGGFEVVGLRTGPAAIRPEDFLHRGDPYPPIGSDSLADRHVVPGAKSPTASGEPDGGLRLEIGARTMQPGVARARGVEFTYRVGHRRYRRSYDDSMYLCAPVEQFPGTACPGEAEGQFDDAAVDFPVAP